MFPFSLTCELKQLSDFHGKEFVFFFPRQLLFIRVSSFPLFVLVGEDVWTTLVPLHKRSRTYSLLVVFYFSLRCHASVEAGCSLSSQPTTDEVGDLEMLRMDFEFGPRLPSLAAAAAAAASRLSSAFVHHFCLSSAASPAVHPHAADRGHGVGGGVQLCQRMRSQNAALRG